MAVGSWGYYLQGNEDQQFLNKAGGELSKVIDCAVHYPAFDKRMFECKCGVLFPVFVVRSALDSGDWSAVLKQHEEGYRPTEENRV